MTAATASLERNPLDAWAARRIGVDSQLLSGRAIADYQLGEIQKTVAWARRKSSFYAERLAMFPAEWPRSLDEFAGAPLTGPSDLIDRADEFLCVPQSEISRVVTLETSGTTGGRKRIFFTPDDQDLALDFFARGVAAMAGEGDRMLLALPGEREGSVGFQLARGITRAGVVPIPHGLVLDPSAAIARMDAERATLLIGLPIQMLAVSLERSEVARRVFRRLHTIVLCSDHVAQSLVERIRQGTGCRIFQHYGSTEMGLGGGIDCCEHKGYHLREADLYFEIVSPDTGERLPEGQLGEVVFTSLGRLGMPLIRYRTGDLSRIAPGPCACGSPLRRLERVVNRVDSGVALGPSDEITIAALDEALLAIPAVYDFAATLTMGTPKELQVRIYSRPAREDTVEEATSALLRLPDIRARCAHGELRLTILLQDQPFDVSGAKRKIGVQPDASTSWSSAQSVREFT